MSIKKIACCVMMSLLPAVVLASSEVVKQTMTCKEATRFHDSWVVREYIPHAAHSFVEKEKYKKQIALYERSTKVQSEAVDLKFKKLDLIEEEAVYVEIEETVETVETVEMLSDVIDRDIVFTPRIAAPLEIDVSISWKLPLNDNSSSPNFYKVGSIEDDMDIYIEKMRPEYPSFSENVYVEDKNESGFTFSDPIDKRPPYYKVAFDYHVGLNDGIKGAFRVDEGLNYELFVELNDNKLESLADKTFPWFRGVSDFVEDASYLTMGSINRVYVKALFEKSTAIIPMSCAFKAPSVFLKNIRIPPSYDYQQ